MNATNPFPPSGEPWLVSQAEFARLQGVDKAHVTRLKQVGRLVMEGGQVNVTASRARITETADLRYPQNRARPAQNAPQGDGAVKVGPPPQDRNEQAAMSLQTARAVKENYAARMAKLEYERESGKLVNADAARLFAADLGATFRGALEILPDRLAPELIPLNDADAISAVLVGAFEQVLSGLAEKIEKGVAA